MDGKGGLKAKTILQYHRVLKKALKDAVVDNLILSNPCENVKPPKVVPTEIAYLDKI